MRARLALVSSMLAPIGILAFAGAAHSHPAPSPGARPVAPQERWYGWQILTIATAVTPPMATGFGLGLGLLTGSEASNIQEGYFLLGGIGAAGFIFGGPTVHFAHGHVERGFLSLGMMVGAGGLGAVFGGAACGGCTNVGSIGGAIFTGSALAMLVANVVDIAVLSYETEPGAGATTGARTAHASLTLLPSIDIARDRATIGLSGTF